MTKPLTISFFLLLLLLPAAVWAQTKKPKTVKKTTPVVTPTPQPTPDTSADVPIKKNGRPAGDTTNDPKSVGRAAYTPVYFYEFTRPGFSYSRVLIEHDDAGKGKISFLKDGFDQLLTDPIQLSATTVANIKGAVTELNFLDSTENYQYAAHDYSNMGNIKFTVKKDGHERTVTYNWTDNKNAKILMDEYRRIGNEYTWMFEMSIARVNQPLQTPGLMDALDSYFERSEISDPTHLAPFLTELTTDERLPLMARNHATKLIKRIEKSKK